MLPFHMTSALILIFSTFMALSSSSFLSIWVAMEINTLSFMPLMKSKSAPKYLLAQSVGSAMILCAPSMEMTSLVLFGAVIKAGIAPFHLWLPQVMKNLNWLPCMALSTWQKVAPIAIVIMLASSHIMCVLVALSSIMGSLGALKQTGMRPLMGYSSVVNMGWVLTGATIGTPLAIFYFAIYALTMTLFLAKLSRMNSKSSPKKDLTLVWILGSMAGLPPFVGFVPKMMVLVMSTPEFFILLIGSSIVMTYLYTSIAVSTLCSKTLSFSGLSSFMVFSTPLMMLSSL